MPGMLDKTLLALLAIAWLLLLFVVARLGERWAKQAHWQRWHPWIYTLALGVYCTTWTFFGSVGQMASTGWWFPPTYLVAIIIFLFGWRFIDKLIRVSKTENISSMADLLAARFGHSHGVATIVTVIAVLGVIPYIALQLKGISSSFEALSITTTENHLWWQDSSLLVTVMMSGFLWLFGMKHYAATDQQPGLMMAIAFESLFKLLALGVIAFFALSIDLPAVTAPSAIAAGVENSSMAYVTQVILGATAMVCLPRQFHVTVVEHEQENDLPHAIKYFSVYLILLGVLLIPLTYVGQSLFAGSVKPDDYVLSIPLSQNQGFVGAMVFLGSLAAGTSMLMISVIALMTMISHTFLIPLTLKVRGLHATAEFFNVVQWLRRFLVLSIIFLAFGYYRWIAEKEALAQIGLISFVAVAQFAPALIGALYWRNANKIGAIAGLTVGGIAWFWILVLPAMINANVIASDTVLFNLVTRPTGTAFGFFGLDVLPFFSSMDLLTQGALLSLGANALLFIVLSLATQQSVHERLQAIRFVSPEIWREQLQHRPIPERIQFTDIQALLYRFLDQENVRQLLSAECAQRNIRFNPIEITVDQQWLRFVRRELTGVIGSASAQLIVDAHIYGDELPTTEMLQLVDAATNVMQFNQNMLLATIDTLNQAVIVIDKDLQVVAWNPKYLEIFELPKNYLSVGLPIEAVLKRNAERFVEVGDTAEFISKRLHHLRLGNAHHAERTLNNGRVLEIHGNALPGGGYVTSYTDISDHKKLALDLQQSNIRLENRVNERTKALALAIDDANEAKRQAEEANLSKTRFLAAASHDLVQPLNAAQLFASALKPMLKSEPEKQVLLQLGQSLQNSEDLLRTLLDISKFDAGVIVANTEPVSLKLLFEQLRAEFLPFANQKNLQLRLRHADYWVYADPSLLRRILQNLISNALRYSDTGGVLISAQKRSNRSLVKDQSNLVSRSDTVRIAIWDTGYGIAPESQSHIFDEFKRNVHADKPVVGGYGLGLAIVKRMARAMNTSIQLRSQPNQGSVFSFDLALSSAITSNEVAFSQEFSDYPLAGMSVMCIDNDPDLLNAIVALLSGWGCEVYAAKNRNECMAQYHREIDVMVADYQLDHDDTGVAVWLSLPEPRPPLVVISAVRDIDIKNHCINHGAIFLQKPVKPLALRGVLQDWYQRQNEAH